jgi:hypothetical protein
MKPEHKSAIFQIKKYPVLIVTCLVSLTLVIWLYFRGSLGDEEQETLDKFVADGAVCRANVTNGNQLQQHVDFLIEANKAIAQRAFRTESLALNLQYFYKLEAEIGVKLTDVRPIGKPSAVGIKQNNSKDLPPTAYIPLNYMVNAQGEFPQIIAFLRQLEGGAYFCRINAASIVGAGSTVTISLDLDLLGLP